MFNGIININNISSDYLNENTYDKYSDYVERFEAKRSQYTNVLRLKQKELSEHPSFQNRIYNNTTLLLFDDINNCIISYCSFSCSNVKSGDELYPAIEIETFAMNKDYCGNKFVIDGGNKSKCSDFSLKFYINHFNDIKNNHIYANVVRLYSDNNPNVVNFYNRNHFFANNRRFKLVGRTGENSDYYFFRYLDG